MSIRDYISVRFTINRAIIAFSYRAIRISSIRLDFKDWMGTKLQLIEQGERRECKLRVRAF